MNEDMLLNSLNENSEDCIIKNRRKRADFLLTTINIFNYLIWAVLLVVMSLCDSAGISFSNLGYTSLDKINLYFIDMAIKISAAVFIISCILLFLSFKRCRRRSDKIKTSIFIGMIISFAIWMYLVSVIYF